MACPKRSLDVLFLCTAHNSLSQRLSLVLRQHGHNVAVELAISDRTMVEAVELSKPDVIVCPFLTKKVPREIYDSILTLVVHPGAPGDAGPSALDWLLLGDDGLEPDPAVALGKLQGNDGPIGRSHWGVTVLQAIEEFDAGPIWAFDQFPVPSDCPTKSSLYRGPVTAAAVAATLAAIDRVLALAGPNIGPDLVADPAWGRLSVGTGEPFLGGVTRTRPLLKPSDCPVDWSCLSSEWISRRLRTCDSQPGLVSSAFGGKTLYLYGGVIEHNALPFAHDGPGSIVAQRSGAVLVATADGKGIWITHVRRLKAKAQVLLPAKLPATLALATMPGLSEALSLDSVPTWHLPNLLKQPGAFQEVWIDYEACAETKIALVYSDFYNGAASTAQCEGLLAAILYAVSDPSVGALVLMGGAYFNNGIHLGVCSLDVAGESWRNINAINDCVQTILETRRVPTFAAIRGNVAAGGFALATACDFVLAVEAAVISPHYRAVGLYGSEYHTLTWNARAGESATRKMMHSMLPMSAKSARDAGLVDHVLEGSTLVDVLSAVERILTSTAASAAKGAPWTVPGPGAPSSAPLAAYLHLAKTIWFEGLPQPLSAYRRQELDFMKLCFVDDRYAQKVACFVGKAAPSSTPFRLALHRRHAHWGSVRTDAEEDPDYFAYPVRDSLSGPPPLAWRPIVSNVTSFPIRQVDSDNATLFSESRSPSRAGSSPGKHKAVVVDISPIPAGHQMTCLYSAHE